MSSVIDLSVESWTHTRQNSVLWCGTGSRVVGLDPCRVLVLVTAVVALGACEWVLGTRRGDNIVEWLMCAEVVTLGVNFEALVDEKLCLRFNNMGYRCQ